MKLLKNFYVYTTFYKTVDKTGFQIHLEKSLEAKAPFAAILTSEKDQDAI